MRLRPTTREVVVSLIILFSFLLFFQVHEIPQSSSLSRSFYQLGAKFGLVGGRPKGEGEIAPGSSEYNQENQTLSTRVRWQNGGAPRTAIVAHVPGMSYCLVYGTDLPFPSTYSGWTIFDRLYVHQGTVYIVTDDPKSVPPLDEITSTGHPIEHGPEEAKLRTPTDQDIQVISPEEADQRFRETALRLEGVTVSLFASLREA